VIRKRHKIRRAPWAPSLVLVALALVTATLSPAAPAAAAPRGVGGPVQNQPQGPQGQEGQGQECPTGTGRTAAASLGYRNAVFTDDFEGDADDLDSQWMRYASDRARHEPGVFDAQPGGSRDPNQVRVAGGVLTITGTPEGRTGGMSTEESHVQAYGLWEARVRLPADAADYHSVMMVLAGSGANLAEMDFMEVEEPSGRVVNGHLHLPPEGEAGDVDGSAPVQDNDWHNWAIEWTPERITLYRDGVRWLQTRDGADNIPRERGHMTIQLDWFPGDEGETAEARLQVDWVRIYEARNG
jgi:Glycosyl hydrolases family 16